MKRVFALSFLLCAAALPVVAAAQTPLAQSQAQRQQILDLEFQMNVPPSISATRTAQLQTQAQQIQTQIDGSDLPALAIPVYGGCDADRAVLSYLQDEVQNGNLDAQSLYTYNRNIYDISVNLKQRGC